jgi:hypothetical protein
MSLYTTLIGARTMVARGLPPIVDGDLMFNKFRPDRCARPVATAATGPCQPCFYDMLESASTLGGYEVRIIECVHWSIPTEQATLSRTTRPLYNGYLVGGTVPFVELAWCEDATPTVAVTDALYSFAGRLKSSMFARLTGASGAVDQSAKNARCACNIAVGSCVCLCAVRCRPVSHRRSRGHVCTTLDGMQCVVPCGMTNNSRWPSSLTPKRVYYCST